MQRTQSLAVAAVAVAAGLRFWSVVDPPVKPPADLVAARDVVLKSLRDDASEFLFEENGDRLIITGIENQIFDSNALVVMQPGPDRQPGVADVDDNANGVVDDVSEMGATRSDDLCVVRRKSDMNPREGDVDADPREPTLVLQRGAFVPVDSADVLSPGQRRRAVVMGRFPGDPWSFQVDWETEMNGKAE